MLVAVATFNQFRFASTQDMHSLKDIHRISPVPWLTFEQLGGIGLIITLFLLAGWCESAMIMAS